METATHIFFYGHHQKFGVFSQWYPSRFTENDITYTSCEQYMMAQKARLFRDEEILPQIMANTDPGVIKKLGRKIANFDDTLWKEHRFAIVCQGNYLKFSQNPELKQILLKTNKILVEASPYDSIWGIGLSIDAALKTPISRWGLNLLGQALMEVRTRLQ